MLFSFLKPEELARKLQKALQSVQIVAQTAKEWNMNYLVTKSDPDGKLIPGIQCEVQLKMLKVKGREYFALLFTKSSGHT